MIKNKKLALSGQKASMRKMFNRISVHYDKLNRCMSFGLDRKWRKNLSRIIKSHKPDNILDIATGTGDMPILFCKMGLDKITGIDISEGMLIIAEKKIVKHKLQNRVQLQKEDAENLSFENKSFDIVSVAYGLRNFENLNRGLSEIFRVLKNVGKLLILETSVPSGLFLKQGFLFYMKNIIPLWGKLFAKNKKAYSYLSTSAIHFPHGEKLKKILEECGFSDVKIIPQAKGCSTIYVANKK